MWSATKPNLPGWLDAPATMTPRGWKRGRKRSNTPARGRGASGGLGGGAAEAARNTGAATAIDSGQQARAEYRVAHHAGHELAAPAHLLRDQQLRVAVLGPAEPEQLARRRPHRGRLGEPEADEITLGLVDDRLSAELQHHREA